MYLSLFPFNLILFNSIYLPRRAGRLVLRRPMYLNSLRIVVAHESFVRGVLCQPSRYSSPICVPCMQPCMQHDCSHLICCLHEPLYIEKNGTGCSCCELICSIPQGLLIKISTLDKQSGIPGRKRVRNASSTWSDEEEDELCTLTGRSTWSVNFQTPPFSDLDMVDSHSFITWNMYNSSSV